MRKTTSSPAASPAAQARAFLASNGLIVVIIMAASFLRFWNLPAQAILLNDAAHDTLRAIQAVESRQVPLTGAESSVPGVFQGPINTWVQMALLVVSGGQLELLFWAFALLSVLGVIATYEFMTVAVEKRLGLVAATLVAFSPLAIAQGRMIYYVALLPLATLWFLWRLLKLSDGRPLSLFWALFAWCLLFQLELGMLPLVLLIPLVWKWSHPTHHSSSKTALIAATLTGLLVGLLPQLLFELTHGLTQLRSFGAWLLSHVMAGGPVRSLPEVATYMWVHGGRIWSVDMGMVTLMGLLLTLGSLIVLADRWHRHQATALEKTVMVGVGLLALTPLVTSVPTEGFFSPAIVLLALLLALGWSHLLTGWRLGGVVLLAGWAGITLITVNYCTFFTGSLCTFNYGASLHEHRRVMAFLKDRQLSTIRFDTTLVRPAQAATFDSWRLVGREVGITEEPQTGQPIYLESKDSPLKSYPGMTRFSFSSQDVYVLH